MTILPVDMPIEQLKRVMREGDHLARTSAQSSQFGVYDLLSGDRSEHEKKRLETLFPASSSFFMGRDSFSLR